MFWLADEERIVIVGDLHCNEPAPFVYEYRKINNAFKYDQVYICPFHCQGNVPLEPRCFSELTVLTPSTTNVWRSSVVIKLETAMANQMYSTIGV
jgi:hypothetical protein